MRKLLGTIILSLLVLVLGSVSCAPQLYSGPRLSPDKVATLKTNPHGDETIKVVDGGAISGFESASVAPYVSRIDDRTIGPIYSEGPFEVLPGQHTLTICLTKDYNPPFYNVNVKVEAGHSYSIRITGMTRYIDRANFLNTKLSVDFSIDDSMTPSNAAK